MGRHSGLLDVLSVRKMESNNMKQGSVFTSSCTVQFLVLLLDHRHLFFILFRLDCEVLSHTVGANVQFIFDASMFMMTSLCQTAGFVFFIIAVCFFPCLFLHPQSLFSLMRLNKGLFK